MQPRWCVWSIVGLLTIFSPTLLRADHWWQELASRVANLDGKPDRDSLALVVVRVTQPTLKSMFERDVQTVIDVDDFILGTDVRGKSKLDAELTLQLKPDDECAAFDAILRGTVTSRTTGYNGPAVINSQAVTRFAAAKRISFEDECGFCAAPPRIKTETRLTNCGVGSQLPGIRGMIVRCVARRRVADSHSQARAIAERNASQRILAEFDKRVETALAKLNDRTLVQQLARRPDSLEFLWARTITTSHDCVQISWGPVDEAEGYIAPAIPTDLLPRCKFDVWIHDSLAGPATDALRAWARARDLARRWLRPTEPVSPALDIDFPRRLPRVTITPVEDWMVVQIESDLPPSWRSIPRPLPPSPSARATTAATPSGEVR
ncbi:MAG: hypothetical protein RIC55_29695 [Pirellulaceae bacterium]